MINGKTGRAQVREWTDILYTRAALRRSGYFLYFCLYVTVLCRSRFTRGHT